MPYIKQADRKKFTDASKIVSKVECIGELNYLLTNIVLAYLKKQKKVNYTVLNSIKGVLDEVKDEFRRRIIVPYEDCKIEKNGDVYATNEIEKSLSVRISSDNSFLPREKL